MHLTDPSRWKHNHDFIADFSAAEKNTRRVLMLRAAMMIAEIIFGLKFHSMALFADGLHMGTHVAAFLIGGVQLTSVGRIASTPTKRGKRLWPSQSKNRPGQAAH
jgi:Co/Zn/Cd efflux system component